MDVAVAGLAARLPLQGRVPAAPRNVPGVEVLLYLSVDVAVTLRGLPLANALAAVLPEHPVADDEIGACIGVLGFQLVEEWRLPKDGQEGRGGAPLRPARVEVVQLIAGLWVEPEVDPEALLVLVVRVGEQRRVPRTIERAPIHLGI